MINGNKFETKKDLLRTIYRESKNYSVLRDFTGFIIAALITL